MTYVTVYITYLNSASLCGQEGDTVTYVDCVHHLPERCFVVWWPGERYGEIGVHLQAAYVAVHFAYLNSVLLCDKVDDTVRYEVMYITFLLFMGLLSGGGDVAIYVKT